MTLLVTMDWLGKRQKVGELSVFSNHGKTSYQFVYAEEWVRNGFQLDPRLPLTASQITHSAVLPGAFQDISPDRWGRMIQQRAHRSGMSEVDSMLCVSDRMRMGALHLSLSGNPETFVSEYVGCPELVHLRDLEEASLRVEKGLETAQDLELLLGPGSSLGGAHPKATVQDGEHLFLAKFQSGMDAGRTRSWEATMLDLAQMAGIPAAEHRLLNKDSERPILLLSRFDRMETKRIPFASAMTLAGAQDDEEFSYALLSDIVSRCSAQPYRDNCDLWRRMVFNAVAGNTDDHLRNHGFLRTRQGWVLSPVYDLNPSVEPFESRIHALNFLDHAHPSLEVCKVLGREYFGLKKADIQTGLVRIGAALAKWRDAARLNGLTDGEIKARENAFEHEAKDRLVHLADRADIIIS